MDIRIRNLLIDVFKTKNIPYKSIYDVKYSKGDFIVLYDTEDLAKSRTEWLEYNKLSRLKKALSINTPKPFTVEDYGKEVIGCEEVFLHLL